MFAESSLERLTYVGIDRQKPKHETVMNVTGERIARVYATAFMNVAAQSPNAAALVDEVGAVISEVLDNFPQLEETFRSALISHEQKEQLLDRMFANRASPEVLNFMKVLSKHGRLELLRPIARLLKKLHAERSGLTDVEIRVPIALDDALRREIEETLRKTLRTEPVIHERVDPSLIAGMIIRVGDRVFDSSIHTQLEHARRHMIELAVEKIETEPDRFVITT
jgi:F-type H+-transporting ATPase subunit delta